MGNTNWRGPESCQSRNGKHIAEINRTSLTFVSVPPHPHLIQPLLLPKTGWRTSRPLFRHYPPKREVNLIALVEDAKLVCKQQFFAVTFFVLQCFLRPPGVCASTRRKRPPVVRRADRQPTIPPLSDRPPPAVSSDHMMLPNHLPRRRALSLAELSEPMQPVVSR